MKFAALAEESVNTVTPVRERLRDSYGGLRDTQTGQLLRLSYCVITEKTGGKNSSLGHNNGLTVPRCF